MFTRTKNTWQMVLHVILRVLYTLDNYTTDLFDQPTRLRVKFELPVYVKNLSHR